jgi:hypothetical protein
MKSYAAFISHKKTHTKHGDSSETLAIRLKVIFGCGWVILTFTNCCLTFALRTNCLHPLFYLGHAEVEINQGLL